MTQQPTVGRIVHYQSYGTPGGEYPPEPRAAIITEVNYTVDLEAMVQAGIDGEYVQDADGARFEPRTGPWIPIEELPKKPVVSVCVINPTGLFFKQGLPFAEEPTPGHWNWPPRTDTITVHTITDNDSTAEKIQRDQQRRMGRYTR
ncbi:hypothetical protein KNV15_gp76 [Gordonia phage Jambalaya]|uniref:Uncharacterized protein n=1 Tax=Gordonia phage Jambalaya TaxID=2743985 RepID=A0A7D5FL33_9CAUD|nr:hypothetical protein KNV15_gp76 [Gordonia phage Jambalaya]QLF84122.1 hypothetical protein SEA_JAMBALAYA_76 [Gordonia phage Jambalaya]